jgi:hypothetical protein
MPVSTSASSAPASSAAGRPARYADSAASSASPERGSPTSCSSTPVPSTGRARSSHRSSTTVVGPDATAGPTARHAASRTLQPHARFAAARLRTTVSTATAPAVPPPAHAHGPATPETASTSTDAIATDPSTPRSTRNLPLITGEWLFRIDPGTTFCP